MDFIVTILYFIIAMIRPQDYFPVLVPLRLAYTMAFPAAIVIALKLAQPEGRATFKTIQPWCVLGIFFMMIFSYVAKTFMLEVSLTFQYFLRVAVPYMLIALTVNTRTRLRIMLLVVLVFVTIMAYNGFLQHETGYGFGGARILGGLSNPHPRLMGKGPFSGPNELGTIYATGIVIMVALFRRGLPNFIKGLPFVAVIPFYFFPLWWTLSRQALITLGAGIGIAMMPKRVLNSWVALVIGGAMFFGAAQFSTRWQGSLGADDSVRRRAAALTAGLRIFKAHPFVGVGRFRSREAAGLHMPLHNSYVIMLAENGFPGLLFFVSLIFMTMLQLYLFVRMVPETKEEKQDVNMARVLMAVIGAVQIGAYFQNRPYHLDSYMYLAMGNAFIVMMIKKYPDAMPKLCYANWVVGKGGMILVGVTVGVVAVLHLTSKIFWAM